MLHDRTVKCGCGHNRHERLRVERVGEAICCKQSLFTLLRGSHNPHLT